MSTHTPGPWSVHRPYQAQFESSGFFVFTDDGRGNGVHIPAFEEDGAEAAANARLIAAAPDLLTALRRIADGSVNALEAHEVAEHYRYIARAAISKATEAA